ncbi:uncharacterized protein TNCV_1852641 [Trichonephila clavipes]|nr:uncharacterized protein TNCV_1852641 [Trichonephila clavipes]
MTAQWYVYGILQPHMCCHSCNGSQEPFFNKTMLSLTCRAYLGPFGTASWASHEFERTRGKVTANMERNVLRHHTELVCLNTRSYRIVHSR